MTQHPQRCETCESFYEERQTPRYRCSWNCCYVHPKDECPCRPSHWEANHSASEPVPEQMGDPWNCTDLGIECPDPEQDWCSWPCDKWLLCHDASIATKARAEVLDELAGPTIRASEEAEQNGDYVSQTCYEDVLKRIAAIRQQEGKP